MTIYMLEVYAKTSSNTWDTRIVAMCTDKKRLQEEAKLRGEHHYTIRQRTFKNDNITRL